MSDAPIRETLLRKLDAARVEEAVEATRPLLKAAAEAMSRVGAGLERAFTGFRRRCCSRPGRLPSSPRTTATSVRCAWLAHQELPAAVAKAVRKSRGGTNRESVALYTPDYLRKLYQNYQKHGLSALADSLSKSGNRTSSCRPEEQALLMKPSGPAI